VLVFVARRLVVGSLLVLVAGVVSFLLLQAAPGSPAEAMVRAQSDREATAGEVSGFDATHGLDGSWWQAVASWVAMAVRGDLGVSLRTGEPVLREFFVRFPATAQLTAAALAVAVLLAVPVGVLSACRRGSVLDHVARVVALVAVALPQFWLGLLLILVFSVQLGWLPAFGSSGPAHVILPAFALGLSVAAVLTRLLRASVLDVLGSNYVRTARAKGLSEVAVVTGHVVRNSLIPVVTVMGLQLGHLLTGAVLVETVFSWPGIGRYFVDAVEARDHPAVQGFVLLFVATVILVNLAVDVLSARLDPRLTLTRGLPS
jgi:peptide/nickel transport system permease protein